MALAGLLYVRVRRADVHGQMNGSQPFAAAASSTAPTPIAVGAIEPSSKRNYCAVSAATKRPNRPEDHERRQALRRRLTVVMATCDRDRSGRTMISEPDACVTPVLPLDDVAS